MAELARNRNGCATPLLSLLTTQDGRLAGRVWREVAPPLPFDMIRVVGDRLSLHYDEGVALVVR